MTSAARPPAARAPAALTVARVLVALQVLGALLGTVAGGLLAAGSAASDRATTAGGSSDPNPWSGVAVAIGIGVLVVGLVAVVVLGVPLLVLRGSTPTRRVTGRGLLVLGEVLLFLPLVTAVSLRAGTVLLLPVEPVSVLVDIVVLSPLVVVACLLTPAVGRWVEPDRAGARGVSSL